MPAKRYFEHGSETKFWEVWGEGTEVFTRHGKTGSNGQVKLKALGSPDEVKAHIAKLVADKTAKEGYVEKGKTKDTKATNGKAAGKATNGKAVKPAKGAKAAPAEEPDAEPEEIEIPKGAIRLELVEGTSSKFWQIKHEEKKLTIMFGKIGTAGQIQVKKFKDEWEARMDHDKLLAEKKRKGYELVMSGPRAKASPAAINPQLEAAILKDPSSDDGYMVYADWLQEQGDIRGELASLQAQLAKNPKDKKLVNAQKKLLWEHRAHFYGPLAVYVSEKKKKTDSWSTPQYAVEETWRQGWMDSLALGGVETETEEDGTSVPGADNVAELIRLLPKVASARLLREFIITRPVASEEYSFHKGIEALARVLPGLPGLRRLTLGRFDMEDSELSWSDLGKADALWPLLPKLEYLKIHAGAMDLGKLNLPELRELWIETGGLDRDNLKSITGASWPKLETLNLWFGQENYGCDCSEDDVAPILDGKKFPKLKHLGIANTTWGNELAPLLVKSKILKQLETLDISKSHLTDEGMTIYAQHKDAFANLAVLDVSECLLSKKGVELAKSLAKTVHAKNQENASEYAPDPDDPDEDEAWWRYSAVGE